MVYAPDPGDGAGSAIDCRVQARNAARNVGPPDITVVMRRLARHGDELPLADGDLDRRIGMAAVSESA
jgi:hypothetical protein